MKKKGHCNLRQSTFSRLGRTRHLFFGDLLKSNEKKLVSGRPDVVIATTRKSVTFKNPSILNTPDNENRSAQYIPKNLNDCAVFIACGRTRKHIFKILAKSLSFSSSFYQSLNGSFNDVACIWSHVMTSVDLSEKSSCKLNL